jgi:Fasciclin domain
VRPIYLIRHLLLSLLFFPLLSLAADYASPLDALAANPQLSDFYSLVKKTGYAEPLATGGDITLLALSNKLLAETPKGARFSNIEMLRDKVPPEAQLLILQALTLDGQYTQTQFDELIATQGSGKAEVITVLGKDAKYKLHRGKDSGTYVLEDARHTGMLIKGGSEIVTQNGTVIVVDANAAIPK